MFPRRALLLLALLGPALLLPTVAAAPKVVDLADTTLDLTVPDPNNPEPYRDDPDHVTVTVSRVDELVEDDSGDLLAARIVDVEFKFDLDTAPDATHPVLINSVPVPLGVSSVTVSTTMVASESIVDVLPKELLAMAFDVGLAEVDVTATEEYIYMGRDADGWLIEGSESTDASDSHVEPLPAIAAAAAAADQLTPVEALDAVQKGDFDVVPDPAPAEVDRVPVRRITITVKVREINGVKVEQMDLVEQIMDILDGGAIVRRPPATLPSTQDPAEYAAMEERRAAHRRHCMNKPRIAALWSRLPRATRVAIASFFASLLFLVFFVALPLAAYVHYKERQAGYSPLSMSEASAAPLAAIPEEDEDGDAAARRADEKAWLRRRDERADGVVDMSPPAQ
jgi:hypothetical protein